MPAAHSTKVTAADRGTAPPDPLRRSTLTDRQTRSASRVQVRRSEEPLNAQQPPPSEGDLGSEGAEVLKVGGKTLMILSEAVWSIYRISAVYLLTASGMH